MLNASLRRKTSPSWAAETVNWLAGPLSLFANLSTRLVILDTEDVVFLALTWEPMVEPVASEPRLFVGQIANDISEEQLRELFSPFGQVNFFLWDCWNAGRGPVASVEPTYHGCVTQIRNLHILKGSDGKPRGCAMVLFSRWGEAERAMEGLNGRQNLWGGPQANTSRPLVVHFANPRRSVPGQPQEHGIAPRKLFVGQASPFVSLSGSRRH
jgi:RNA recognition motif-containing protein